MSIRMPTVIPTATPIETITTTPAAEACKLTIQKSKDLNPLMKAKMMIKILEQSAFRRTLQSCYLNNIDRRLIITKLVHKVH